MKRFTDALLRCSESGKVPVIPDFKVFSPRDGPLFQGRNILDAARHMERAGAPVLSVVTESKEFHGSLELLCQIAATVCIPLLRKDFIRTPEDIAQTARCGAAAILLICSCMDETQLRTLYHTALDYGLEPLIETHSVQELELAASLGAQLVGINNRDILKLERDGGTVETTAQLGLHKPDGAFLISESGIQTPMDIQSALKSGADAVLVGTAIWKAPDPFAFYRRLSTKEA